MGQTTTDTELASNSLEICAPRSLSCSEAQSLLRLLCPQGAERNFSDTALLSTPNGGRLYVKPYLYG